MERDVTLCLDRLSLKYILGESHAYSELIKFKGALEATLLLAQKSQHRAK